ncbi:transcription factor IIIA-like [Wyeomyia smithii]|uniref:transcription factor IIIA-like n=1 Tax=Wyeomyia smithii TaxID=174621 RepID=UPI002467AF1F|nr:transcription factor IIIA-like [Wyeomyia smithii]
MVSEADSSDTDRCPALASEGGSKTEYPAEPTEDAEESAQKQRQTFCCEECKIVFRKRDHYDRHRFTHTGVREYRCPQADCSKEYTNRTHLNRHIRTNHAEKPAQPGKPINCKHTGCVKMFSTELGMRRHYELKHILGKSWPCPDCGERFWRKLQLKQHSFKHTGQYPHRCDICEKGFMNLKSLRNHRTTHALHKCESCPAEFTRWTDLVAHRKLQHVTFYQCDICKGKFPTKRNLKMHIKIHCESQEVFQCPHEGCPKFYEYERNLMAHIRSKHEGTRKYVCSVPECARALATKQKLDQHRRMHESAARSVPRMKVPSSTKRKDSGLPKRSSAARLANVQLEPHAERILIQQSPDRRPPVEFECTASLDSASESELETSGKVEGILQGQLAKIQEQIRLLRDQTVGRAAKGVE